MKKIWNFLKSLFHSECNQECNQGRNCTCKKEKQNG